MNHIECICDLGVNWVEGQNYMFEPRCTTTYPDTGSNDLYILFGGSGNGWDGNNAWGRSTSMYGQDMNFIVEICPMEAYEQVQGSVGAGGY
jgi:hypothetical protein